MWVGVGVWCGLVGGGGGGRVVEEVGGGWWSRIAYMTSIIHVWQRRSWLLTTTSDRPL